MKNFNNKVVAITGASSGIGQALAIAFAARGASLALSDVQDLAQTAMLCKEENSHVKVLLNSVDVSSEEAVAQWAKTIFEYYGQINMIINNAGIALSTSVSAMEYADHKKLMNINYWGVVYGTKEFLPYLEKTKDAHIVNVSSVYGLIGIPDQSAYCSAKFAVRGFTQTLFQELSILNSHIHCSYVCPGGIKTNIAINGIRKERVSSSLSDQESIDRFEKKLARTSSKQAAKTIIQGIEKNTLEILVGLDAHFIQRIVRFVPRLARYLILNKLND